MVKVKICGLKRIDDIEYINKLCPDYAGFVFAKSKRQVDLNLAHKLINRLDKNIKTVGVFVNESIENVFEIAETLKLDVLQFHGDETQDYIDNFRGFTVWKAIRVNSKNDLEKTKQFITNAFLFDTLALKDYGGTGKTFDWNILKDIKFDIPIILAGGLNADNVTEALKIINPFAVDVSSGVETEGYKDFNKIELFIKKVREIS